MNQQNSTCHVTGKLFSATFLQHLLQQKPQSSMISEGEWQHLRSRWQDFQQLRKATTPIDLQQTWTSWVQHLFTTLGLSETSDTYQTISRSKANGFARLDDDRVGVVSAAYELAQSREQEEPSAHSQWQVRLNQQDSAWGLLCNGCEVRFMRSSESLSHRAELSFDLIAIMDLQDRASFHLLYLLCQAFVGAISSVSIESLYQRANRHNQQTFVARQDGFHQALLGLGQGLLQHPNNEGLRHALAQQIGPQNYVEQLFIVLYRLLFLRVSEDRQALFVPDVSRQQRQRYMATYGFVHLQQLAQQQPQGTEVWRLLLDLMTRMPYGLATFGVMPINTQLWSTAWVEQLAATNCTNQLVFEVIQQLGLHQPAVVTWYVQHPEELGAIYESLLDLTPTFDKASGQFQLTAAAGSQRKTSGSYYTPLPLVESLLQTTLTPVVTETVQGLPARQAASALLKLRLCDPSCGTGFFLLAATKYLALRLAQLQTGDQEPGPQARQAAARQVVRNCIFAVDRNPVAVELSKILLWLTAPSALDELHQLDHHLRCGDALLGATWESMAGGIPDSAFTAVAFESRKAARKLRQANQLSRQGKSHSISRQIQALQATDSIAPSDLWLVADAWCAAFFWPCEDPSHGITEGTWLDLLEHPDSCPAPLRKRIEWLAEQHQFFHWQLAFPTIFSHERHGFDVILGNPPWERIKLQEKEFFALRDDTIAQGTAKQRQRHIADLAQRNPQLWQSYVAAKQQADKTLRFLRHCGLYPLCARGDTNTYAVFAELNLRLLSKNGLGGCVYPSGIWSDKTYQPYFQALMVGKMLHSLLAFDSRTKYFAKVKMQFSLLTVGGRQRSCEKPVFAFQLLDISEANKSRCFTMRANQITKVNPLSSTCPNFRSARDAAIVLAIYERFPVIGVASELQCWRVQTYTMYHMTNHSRLFRAAGQLQQQGFRYDGYAWQREQEEYLPLMEGKYFYQFDHRAASYEATTGKKQLNSAIRSVDDSFTSRYWVERQQVEQFLQRRSKRSWLLLYRWVARSSDPRTFISTVVPYAAVGNSAPLLLIEDADPFATLLFQSLVSSLVFDYVLRQKLPGANVTFAILRQLALPSTADIQDIDWLPKRSFGKRKATVENWFVERSFELCWTAWDMKALAVDCGIDSPPFEWHEERRQLLRAELDAAVFQLFLCPDESGDDLVVARNDMLYILDSFPKLATGYGQQVVAIFDQMTNCRLSGGCYDGCQPSKSS